MEISNPPNKKMLNDGHKVDRQTWKNRWTPWEFQQRGRKYKYQTEVITALKSILDKFDSRMKKIEEQVSELKDKETQLTQTEQQNLKKKKNISGKIHYGTSGTTSSRIVFPL